MPYDDSLDRPHTASAHPLWQESDCYWFYDAAAGIGGFHRIGQHPNLEVGQVMLFVFERGGERYLSVRNYPVSRASRTQTGQRVGTSSVEAPGGGRITYAWGDADCEGKFTFGDAFYSPRDWSRAGRGAGALDKMNADGHLECSGRIEGEVRIGRRTARLRALAHRDRSWGPRDHGVVAQHRMLSGTVGPSLSFAVFTMGLKAGGRHGAGFVVRNGTESEVLSARLLTTFDNDGVSVTGGLGLLKLDTGETLRIPVASVQGFVSNVSNLFFSTDTISSLELPEGTGFCDLEVSNNPSHGSHIPTQAEVTLACAQEGLSAFTDCQA